MRAMRADLRMLRRASEHDPFLTIGCAWRHQRRHLARALRKNSNDATKYCAVSRLSSAKFRTRTKYTQDKFHPGFERVDGAEPRPPRQIVTHLNELERHWQARQVIRRSRAKPTPPSTVQRLQLSVSTRSPTTCVWSRFILLPERGYPTAVTSTMSASTSARSRHSISRHLAT
jgi:hypothetical protein